MESNRIKHLRTQRRISQTELGKMLNSGRSTVVKLERGEMRLTTEWMARIARALECEPADLLPSAEDKQVPIVGYVGVDAEVILVDDNSAQTVICPRGLDPEQTIAIEVREGSMFPIEDGWVLFFTRSYEGVPIDAVGHFCAVKIANSGAMLVKHLRLGSQANRFTLFSASAGPLENIALDWAARIRAMLPPDLARPTTSRSTSGDIRDTADRVDAVLAAHGVDLSSEEREALTRDIHDKIINAAKPPHNVS
ncbi:MAG: helix-turn-helix domain-containing protein [Alphaproteobacteria bacterium]|nr:helix-turn-helix domain-containing protein [Alphaproteobacteria bacterium]